MRNFENLGLKEKFDIITEVPTDGADSDEELYFNYDEELYLNSGSIKEPDLEYYEGMVLGWKPTEEEWGWKNITRPERVLSLSELCTEGMQHMAELEKKISILKAYQLEDGKVTLNEMERLYPEAAQYVKGKVENLNVVDMDEVSGLQYALETELDNTKGIILQAHLKSIEAINGLLQEKLKAQPQDKVGVELLKKEVEKLIECTTQLEANLVPQLNADPAETTTKNFISDELNKNQEWKEAKALYTQNIEKFSKKISAIEAYRNVQQHGGSQTAKHLRKVCAEVQVNRGRLVNFYSVAEAATKSTCEEVAEALQISKDEQTTLNQESINKLVSKHFFKKSESEFNEAKEQFSEDMREQYNKEELSLVSKLCNTLNIDIEEDEQDTSKIWNKTCEKMEYFVPNINSLFLDIVAAILKEGLEKEEEKLQAETDKKKAKAIQENIAQLIAFSDFLYDLPMLNYKFMLENGRQVWKKQEAAAKEKIKNATSKEEKEKAQQEYDDMRKEYDKEKAGFKIAQYKLEVFNNMAQVGQGKWMDTLAVQRLSHAGMFLLDAVLVIGGTVGVPVGLTAAAMATGMLTEEMMGVEVEAVMSALSDGSFEGFIHAVSGINPYFATAFAVAAVIGLVSFVAMTYQLHKAVQEHGIDSLGGVKGLAEVLNNLSRDCIENEMEIMFPAQVNAH